MSSAQNHNDKEEKTGSKLAEKDASHQDNEPQDIVEKIKKDLTVTLNNFKNSSPTQFKVKQNGDILNLNITLSKTKA